MQKIFKRSSVILIFLLIYLFCVKVNASNTYFVWEKIEIDVPVYSSLEEYKDDYVVKFYVDGRLSSDFVVETEVNCSTFSTVLTNKVGQYTVYYKAYSKSNYVSSVQAIVFNVIDITAPVINLKSEIVNVEYGKKLSDYDWYSVIDDTCELTELSIYLDESAIIYNVAGTYNAELIVTDLYNNSSCVNFKVKIIDNEKPNILVLKPLFFSYNEEVNIKEYIRCSDNYNNDITDLLEIRGLDTSKLGKQEISLKVTDYSNNTSEAIFEVIIIDKIPPTITLKEGETTLDIRYYETYTSDYFKEYIYSIFDNYSKPELITLEIDTDKLENNVADYLIYFIAIDENNNKSKQVLKVKLREFVGPEIIGEDVLYLKLGEEINLYSLVTVVDIYDENAEKRLTIDYEEFDINKRGTYDITYSCFNTSGIYSEKVIRIIVEDDSEIMENFDFKTIISDPIFKFVAGLMIIIGCGIIILITFVKRKKINY